MSSFIDTCEDDAFAAAARFVADATSSPEIGDADVFARNAPQYVDSVLKKKGELYALGGAEKDVEAFFTVLASTAAKLEGAVGETVLRKIVDGVGGTASTEHAALRLRILFALFNASSEPAFRYHVFLSTLQLATAANLTETLLPSLKRAEEWAKEWKLAKPQIRDLYKAVSALLRESKGGAKESYAFLLKFLATFDDASPAELNGVAADASRAAQFFIAAPDMFQSDLLELAAVKNLSSQKDHSALHALLVIVLTGDLAAYKKWHDGNKAALSAAGLSHDELVTKMRLMSLIALGAESSTGEVAYDAVQGALQCDKEEVEQWVVRAIGAKLLEAKLDQVRRVVVVTRSTHRIFGKQQWQDLKQRLTQWSENITSVRSTLPAAPPPPAAAPAHPAGGPPRRDVKAQ